MCNLLILLLRLLRLVLKMMSHTSPNTLIQFNKRIIPKPPLRLVNAVVFAQRTVPHLLPREIRRLPQRPKRPLKHSPNRPRKVAVQLPHAAQRQAVSALVPYRASKVPEVHRLTVRDEEGFAIYALMVQRNGGNHPVGHEESLYGEEMPKRHVLDVREVEEVLVGTDLELRLALAVGAHHGGNELDVALAEDASGSDGARQKVRGCAVCLEDGELGDRLGGGVVFWLGVAEDHWPCLCGVDELGFGAEDDARRGGVDEGFDAGFLGGLEEVLGSLDVDLVVDGGGEVEVGGCRVDYCVRLELLEELLEEGEVGDVGVVVGDLGGGMAVG